MFSALLGEKCKDIIATGSSCVNIATVELEKLDVQLAHFHRRAVKSFITECSQQGLKHRAEGQLEAFDGCQTI